MPDRDGYLTVHLGDFVKRHSVGPTDPEWPNILAGYQNLYQETRERVLAGDGKPDLHRMLLTHWMSRHRTNDYRQFVPDGLPDESPVQPQTTITDDFNRSNANPMSDSAEGWSWADQNGGHKIVSNTARGEAGQSRARAESDLSSVDHQAFATKTAASGYVGGVTIRCSSSADTCYRMIRVTSSNNRISKVITGTVTNLQDYTNSTSPPLQIGGRANGNQISYLIDGAVIGTITDTAIASGTRTGIAGNAAPSIMDNFSAYDILKIPIVQHHRAMQGVT